MFFQMFIQCSLRFVLFPTFSQDWLLVLDPNSGQETQRKIVRERQTEKKRKREKKEYSSTHCYISSPITSHVTKPKNPTHPVPTTARLLRLFILPLSRMHVYLFACLFSFLSHALVIGIFQTNKWSGFTMWPCADLITRTKFPLLNCAPSEKSWNAG